MKYDSVPKDITEQFMKVMLHTSRWTASTKDDTVTQEVIFTKAAQSGAGAFRKRLAQHAAVVNVDFAFRKLRKFFHDNTLPWNRKNKECIIRTSKFTELANGLQAIEMECQTVLNTLYLEWDDVIEHAKNSELGAMFNASDYPSLEDLKKKYSIKFEYGILQDSEDVRVQTSVEVVNQLKDAINAQNMAGQTTAMNDLWKRLYEPVKAMADKLSDPSAQRYHKSLIGNIMDVTKVIQDMNVANDPNINQFVIDVESKLGVYDPDTFKDNEQIKNKAASDAKELAEKMAAFIDIPISDQQSTIPAGDN